MNKTISRLYYGLSFALILGCCAARFVNLEQSPPGFYRDESAGAMNIICISQQGTSEGGIPYPLLFPEFGSFHTAPYVYFGAQWIKIFGHSIGAIRSIAAFFTVLTILGIWLLSSFLIGPQFALFATLAASISPWSFQFSRIAWDPPLMPCFLIWGILFFLKENSKKATVAAAFLFSMAMYSYPPARVQAPLMILFLSFWKLGKLGNKSPTKSFIVSFIFSFVLPLILICLPLAYLTFNGTMQGRFNMLSIFSPQYRASLPSSSFIYPAWVLIRNIALHFNPSYLFVHGDGNLRHSTQYFGEFSWLDIFSLCVGLLLPLMSFFKRKLTHKVVLWMCGAGILSAVLPAALTWEGIPHSLRSLGAWPFLSLLTGYFLFQAMEISKTVRIPIQALVLIISSFFILSFGTHFFRDYPNNAPAWFDSEIKQAAMISQQTGNWSLFAQAIKSEPYPDVSARYYLIQYGGENCKTSHQKLFDLKRLMTKGDSIVKFYSSGLF